MNANAIVGRNKKLISVGTKPKLIVVVPSRSPLIGNRIRFGTEVADSKSDDSASGVLRLLI